MDNAYQSFEDLLGQEPWLQQNPWADPFPMAESSVFDDWAQWQTTQPPISGLATMIEASVTRPGSGHEMNREEFPNAWEVEALRQSHLSDPSTFGQNVNSTAFVAGNSVNASDYEASIKEASSVALTRKWTYPRTTCATCDGPLDAPELLLHVNTPNVYCTRTKTASHLAVVCDHYGCGEKFATLEELKNHSLLSGHKSFCCSFPECKQQLSYIIIRYFPSLHMHREIKFICAQCGSLFERQTDLDDHAGSTMHAAHACEYPDCGSESTRLADLVRHQMTHLVDTPRHPCPHCRNYRGKNGFKRKDHLRQHIRNYHRIEDFGSNAIFSCCNEACENDNNGVALKSIEDLTTHMHDRHSSSPYVCQIEGCDRVLMNGFESDKLLKLHVKKDHPSPFQCRHPGCDRVGTKGWMRERDMVKHMKNVHGITN